MTNTLVRGQILEALFAEAPASEESVILFLRRRHSIGTYITEVMVEGVMLAGETCLQYRTENIQSRRHGLNPVRALRKSYSFGKEMK